MKATRSLWGPLAWMLLGGGMVMAEEPGVEPVAPAAVSAPAPDCTGCSTWFTPGCHANPCKPSCCGENRLFCPFEIYARIGPSFVGGKDEFDDLYHTGIAAQFGARAYCYAHDHSGAWIGDFGIDYVNNGGKSQNRPILLDNGFPTEPVQLQRVYVRLGGGYEWYCTVCDGCKTFVEVDGGGKVGHAHGTFRAFPDQTDIPWAIYLGTGAGVLFPQCGYDITLGVRLEIAHEWIEMIRDHEGMDTASVFLTGGLRY